MHRRPMVSLVSRSCFKSVTTALVTNDDVQWFGWDSPSMPSRWCAPLPSCMLLRARHECLRHERCCASHDHRTFLRAAGAARSCNYIIVHGHVDCIVSCSIYPALMGSSGHFAPAATIPARIMLQVVDSCIAPVLCKTCTYLDTQTAAWLS